MILRSALVPAVTVGLGGLALALAFPGADWEGLAWVALAPIVLLALERRPALAFSWAWLGGLVFFLTLLHWLNFTFQTYSAIPWPLTWLPTAALSGYCALYIGLVAAAISWIARRRSTALALAVAPFLWVAAEWVRGHLMGGFPWGALGYSQYRALAVIQVAEIGGVYAVSFVLAAVNAAVAASVVLPWRRALVALALGVALIGATLGFGAARLHARFGDGDVKVSVMQPSIEQPLKWDPNHAVATARLYLSLTEAAAAEKPDLIVWPETASPTVLRQDPALLDVLRDLSARYEVPLVVGSVDIEGTPPRLRNTAFLLTGRGIIGRYDKIHLVPFGEYVPLSGVIGFVRAWAEFISDLEAGTRAVVFPGPPAPFGIVICYEGIFPELFREFVRGGARLMVNMTNDGWFGRTSGPLQHLAMYPFRAVEHRIAVVRVANTGVSAMIEPTGRIASSMGLFERGVLRGRVPLRSTETLYTRLGDWLAYLGLAVSAAVLATTLFHGVRHAR